MDYDKASLPIGIEDTRGTTSRTASSKYNKKTRGKNKFKKKKPTKGKKKPTKGKKKPTKGKKKPTKGRK